MPEINWIAVVIATLGAFAAGAVWYSPLLFSKAWQREIGMTDADLNGANMPLMFGGTLVLLLLASIVFAMFLGPTPGLQLGIGAGFSAGLFWVAAGLGINYLYERRSLKLWLINGGYNVVTFTIIGAVIGAMG